MLLEKIIGSLPIVIGAALFYYGLHRTKKNTPTREQRIKYVVIGVAMIIFGFVLLMAFIPENQAHARV